MVLKYNLNIRIGPKGEVHCS